nr:hypothetical protein [Amycolatopsis alkalitolerans]
MLGGADHTPQADVELPPGLLQRKVCESTLIRRIPGRVDHVVQFAHVLEKGGDVRFSTVSTTTPSQPRGSSASAPSRRSSSLDAIVPANSTSRLSVR